MVPITVCKLNYSGPRLPFDMHSRDIFGVRYEIANRKILKEINLGRIAGPFPEHPFPPFRVSIYLYSHTAKYNGTEKNNNIIIT
jgi:hypothetical protein